MAKITLGKRPKNFKKIVKFPLVEGGEASIECLFKYRSRLEFGLFIDELLDAAKLKPTVEDGEAKFSMADLMEKTADSNAKYLMEVLDGWNLDEPLTLATAQQLADEFPGGAAAVMEAYRAAVSEGRLGN